jgi:hypothetical protein
MSIVPKPSIGVRRTVTVSVGPGGHTAVTRTLTGLLRKQQSNPALLMATGKKPPVQWVPYRATKTTQTLHKAPLGCVGRPIPVHRQSLVNHTTDTGFALPKVPGPLALANRLNAFYGNDGFLRQTQSGVERFIGGPILYTEQLIHDRLRPSYNGMLATLVQQMAPPLPTITPPARQLAGQTTWSSRMANAWQQWRSRNKPNPYAPPVPPQPTPEQVEAACYQAAHGVVYERQRGVNVPDTGFQPVAHSNGVHPQLWSVFQLNGPKPV